MNRAGAALNISIDCDRGCTEIIKSGKVYRCSHYIWSLHKYPINGSGENVSRFDPTDAIDPKMPWGKYRDSGLSELPNDYLLWLLQKAEQNDLTPIYLNDRVIEEWKRRKDKPT